MTHAHRLVPLNHLLPQKPHSLGLAGYKSSAHLAPYLFSLSPSHSTRRARPCPQIKQRPTRSSERLQPHPQPICLVTPTHQATLYPRTHNQPRRSRLCQAPAHLKLIRSGVRLSIVAGAPTTLYDSELIAENLCKIRLLLGTPISTQGASLTL